MKSNLRNTIIVPTDFTTVAECALDNAIKIAKIFDYDICLLHVVSKHVTKADKERVNDQLIDLTKKHSKKANIKISYFIKEGSIYNSIANAVKDLSASLIVIGIHGSEKESNILGSFAYNVICSSSVPVLVVKKCYEEVKDNTLVLPVDFSYDNVKAVDLAIMFAKELSCQVHVTGVLFSKDSLYKTIVSKEKKESRITNIAKTIENAGITVKSDIVIKPKTILVPTDFTPVAAKALEHAVELAKAFERKICILHVVSKDAKQSHVEKVKTQLEHITEDTKRRFGVEVSFIIKPGSIFDVIPDTVNEISAGLMVIGFHGRQGVEHVAGGFAYTIIRNSTVPVMVVKKNHTDISDNHIVVPVTLPHESLEKINKSLKFAQAFKCLIHVIGVLHIDDISAKKEKESLHETISSYLVKKGVEYKAEVLIKSNSLMVPIDFTETTINALNYAVEIANRSEKNICLLHIVAQGTKESARKKAESKLKEIAEKKSKSSGTNISYIIEEGSIFNVISNTANEISADLIVMGVHGKKGLQHILGSNAFKVIKGSKVPVMVVKKDYPKHGIKNVVLPLSIEHESTKKVFVAIDFARYFNSSVHIVSFLHSKGTVFKIEKEALMKNVSSHIENAGINVESKIINIGKSNTDDSFVEYAKKINSDLIIVVAKKSGKLSEILGQNFAEQIISKTDIPILNIIPYAEFDEDESYAVGSFVDPLGLMRKE